MMIKTIIDHLLKAASIMAVFFLFYGCYPKGPEYYSDLDLTATNYDADYDHGNQKFYWMADTVKYITNIEDNEIDPGDVEALIQKVESKFEERNYIRLDLEDYESSDFIITINVVAKEYKGVGWIPGPPCYPGWWGCYPGYYPPYWGGYYGYSYTTGSVIINWYDPQVDPVSF